MLFESQNHVVMIEDYADLLLKANRALDAAFNSARDRDYLEARKHAMRANHCCLLLSNSLRHLAEKGQQLPH